MELTVSSEWKWQLQYWHVKRNQSLKLASVSVSHHMHCCHLGRIVLPYTWLTAHGEHLPSSLSPAPTGCSNPSVSSHFQMPREELPVENNWAKDWSSQVKCQKPTVRDWVRNWVGEECGKEILKCKQDLLRASWKKSLNNFSSLFTVSS